MTPFRLALNILRYLGPRIVWLRATVYLRESLGLTSRVFRSRAWDDLSLTSLFQPGVPVAPDEYRQYKTEHAPAFCFPLGEAPTIPSSIREGELHRQPDFARRLELLRQDRCVYFFKTPSPAPVDWYANPFGRLRSEPGGHFCQVPMYLPQQGDPRVLWEPSRAAWAMDCAKAAAYRDAEDTGEIYWRWVDSWMDSCPPFQGFQWKCGQESTVRLMAVLFGFWALAHDPATTADRYVQIARLAWATGYRVYHHINYALSQKNNHATSEALGLLLVGQLFPELKDSSRWVARGRRVLADEIRRQTYDDGSYLQNSMFYHRVMAQAAVLGLRLGELAEQPFARDVYDCLGRCADFLFAMLDPETGETPKYGDNDGAYILPLSECGFHDFRPIVQTLHYTVHRKRLLPSGPWDEDLIWLFGHEAIAGPAPPLPRMRSASFSAGGYYTLRQRDSWCFLRCHTHRDRPAQYDQLHLDVWWKGQNILRDCGTFQYYVPGRSDLEVYFRSIRSHNTVEVDGQNPLERVSRFLWFPWPRGTMRRYRADADGPLMMEAEHYDYDRKPWHVLHRRTVIGLPEEGWVIVDDLLGRGKHQLVARWHLADLPFRLDAQARMVTLETAAGELGIGTTGSPREPAQIVVRRGDDDPDHVQGLASSYYGEYEPIPTVEATWNGCSTQRIVTAVCPRLVAAPYPLPSESGVEQWAVETDQRMVCLRLTRPDRAASQVYLARSCSNPRSQVK